MLLGKSALAATPPWICCFLDSASGKITGAFHSGFTPKSKKLAQLDGMKRGCKPCYCWMSLDSRTILMQLFAPFLRIGFGSSWNFYTTGGFFVLYTLNTFVWHWVSPKSLMKFLIPVSWLSRKRETAYLGFPNRCTHAYRLYTNTNTHMYRHT